MIPLLLFTSCSSRKKKAEACVKAINYEHQLVVNRLDALERSLESYIPEGMDRAYQQVMAQLDSSEVVIRGLKGMKMEDDLRDDALLMFDTYRLLLENEYVEIIKRQKKPAGAFTVADEFLVNNLGRHININRQRAKVKFEKEAAVVLEKYGVPFEPVADELSDVSSAKTQDSTTPAP
jgi:hypothetical protein